MAKATLSKPPAFVGRLVAELRRQLAGAEVTTEHIRGSRYRFIVVSNRFARLGHPERQRRVWSIAESVVPRPDLLDVGMILTIAPNELHED